MSILKNNVLGLNEIPSCFATDENSSVNKVTVELVRDFLINTYDDRCSDSTRSNNNVINYIKDRPSLMRALKRGTKLCSLKSAECSQCQSASLVASFGKYIE